MSDPSGIAVSVTDLTVAYGDRPVMMSFDGDRVTDFHMWSIGSGIYAASLSVVTNQDKTAEDIRKLITRYTGIVHTTIELQKCSSLSN